MMVVHVLLCMIVDCLKYYNKLKAVLLSHDLFLNIIDNEKYTLQNETDIYFKNDEYIAVVSFGNYTFSLGSLSRLGTFSARYSRTHSIVTVRSERTGADFQYPTDLLADQLGITIVTRELRYDREVTSGPISVRSFRDFAVVGLWGLSPDSALVLMRPALGHRRPSLIGMGPALGHLSECHG